MFKHLRDIGFTLQNLLVIVAMICLLGIVDAVQSRNEARLAQQQAESKLSQARDRELLNQAAMLVCVRYGLQGLAIETAAGVRLPLDCPKRLARST